MKDETIYAWLDDLDATPAIKANQNGPKPVGAFLTWQLVTTVPVGAILDTGEIDGTDINWEYTRRFREVYSLDAWAIGGGDMLDRIVTAAQMIQSARKILADDGAVLLNAGPVHDLTRVIDTKFVPHFQADLTFAAYHTITSIDTDGVVNTTDLAGAVETPQETIIPVTAHAEREEED